MNRQINRYFLRSRLQLLHTHRSYLLLLEFGFYQYATVQPKYFPGTLLAVHWGTARERLS